MPMNSYQYGTSPRKYEPDYTEVKVKKDKIENKMIKITNDIGTKCDKRAGFLCFFITATFQSPYSKNCLKTSLYVLLG